MKYCGKQNEDTYFKNKINLKYASLLVLEVKGWRTVESKTGKFSRGDEGDDHKKNIIGNK